MAYTIVYSDYNGYPGNAGNYDFLSGRENPVLPTVNLYNSFNVTVKSTTINGNPSTTETAANASPYSATGVRRGQTTSPERGYAGVHIARVPTAMRWIDNLGPNGDGIAQNEKGDWFSREVLQKADRSGGGVTFTEIPRSGTDTLNFITTSADYEDATQMIVPAWNFLGVNGSYNSSVFCYNKFEYTDDYEGTIYEVKSLFELPEKFDNLISFIPDQREQTILTFTVEVDWQVYSSWGIYGDYYSESQKSTMLSTLGYSGVGDTGTDVHVITQTVTNRNQDWAKILKDTLRKQRTLDEQHERYGQTFPSTQIEIIPPQSAQ